MGDVLFLASHFIFTAVPYQQPWGGHWHTHTHIHYTNMTYHHKSSCDIMCIYIYMHVYIYISSKNVNEKSTCLNLITNILPYIISSLGVLPFPPVLLRQVFKYHKSAYILYHFHPLRLPFPAGKKSNGLEPCQRNVPRWWIDGGMVIRTL